jgi:hypothetical protein
MAIFAVSFLSQVATGKVTTPDKQAASWKAEDAIGASTAPRDDNERRVECCATLC